MIITNKKFTAELKEFNENVPKLIELMKDSNSTQKRLEGIMAGLNDQMARVAETNETFVKRLEDYLGLKLTMERQKLDIEKKAVEDLSPTPDDMRF